MAHRITSQTDQGITITDDSGQEHFYPKTHPMFDFLNKSLPYEPPLLTTPNKPVPGSSAAPSSDNGMARLKSLIAQSKANDKLLESIQSKIHYSDIAGAHPGPGCISLAKLGIAGSPDAQGKGICIDPNDLTTAEKQYIIDQNEANAKAQQQAQPAASPAPQPQPDQGGQQ